MWDELKEKQVCDILLMPISCQSNAEIYREKDKIISGQRYPQNLDEDMSDFAIGFYEIIYKDLLGEKTILNDNNGFLDKEFAGDTMNSYNNIAKRKSSEESIEYLSNYKKQYHCLANFWLIPMDIGRTLKKWCKASGETKDYMDRFLLLYKSNSDNYRELYPNYFKRINGINDFSNKHFLTGNYLSEDMEVNNFSNDKYDRKEVIDAIQHNIKLRAVAISESKFSEQLWKYFNDKGILI